MTLKEFIHTYSSEFKTNRLFLINKGKDRTEMLNPNADLLDNTLEIDSWNVQTTIEKEEEIITFFIYLKD